MMDEWDRARQKLVDEEKAAVRKERRDSARKRGMMLDVLFGWYPVGIAVAAIWPWTDGFWGRFPDFAGVVIGVAGMVAGLAIHNRIVAWRVCGIAAGLVQTFHAVGEDFCLLLEFKERMAPWQALCWTGCGVLACFVVSWWVARKARRTTRRRCAEWWRRVFRSAWTCTAMPIAGLGIAAALQSPWGVLAGFIALWAGVWFVVDHREKMRKGNWNRFHVMTAFRERLAADEEARTAAVLLGAAVALLAVGVGWFLAGMGR